MMAVEYKPFNYYVSDQKSLGYINIICLIIAILGHTYFARLWNCLCKRKRSRDIDKNLELEIRKYEKNKSDKYSSK